MQVDPSVSKARNDGVVVEASAVAVSTPEADLHASVVRSSQMYADLAEGIVKQGMHYKEFFVKRGEIECELLEQERLMSLVKYTKYHDGVRDHAATLRRRIETQHSYARSLGIIDPSPENMPKPVPCGCLIA